MRVNKHNNFVYLTISLVVMLLASSMLELLPRGLAGSALQLVTLITLIVCYLSLNFGPLWRRFIGLIVVLLIVSSALREGFDWRQSGLMDLLTMLLFFTVAAYVSARQVLLTGVIDGNKIVGSIAIFLLLGLVWSMLYLITLEFSATAFVGMEPLRWVDNFSSATYFSYVTLTTLGYGDISPAQPVSRVLVYLEAIVGVFYMAIVVASLVGAKAGAKQQHE